MRRRADRQLEATVTRELGELKRAMRDWQKNHEKTHTDAERRAVTGRRFMITTCITALGLLVTVLALVLQVYGRTRGLLPLARAPGRVFTIRESGNFHSPRCGPRPEHGTARASRSGAPSLAGHCHR